MVASLGWDDKTNKVNAVKEVNANEVAGSMDIPIETVNLELDNNYLTETSNVNTNLEGVSDVELSEEELKLLLGEMSQEDYDKFIEGMETYYGEQVDFLESLLHTENGDGYQDILDKVNNLITLVTNGYSGMAYNYQDQINQLLEPLKKYGVNSVTEAFAFKREMEEHVNQLNESIKMTKNVRDSAKYDYLEYLKDYANFKTKEITQADLDSLDKDANMYDPLNATIIAASVGGAYNGQNYERSYSYTQYSKLHPEISPVEFVKMIQEKNPDGRYVVYDIANFDELKTLVTISDNNPQLAKTYAYLFEQDPEKAKQFLKDCEYEINNYKGQLEAKQFLDILATVDGKDELDEIVYNEFGVHLEGLMDGLSQFGEGVGYSVEALGTLLGICEENRVMSPSEYKRMYILQALLSKEDKEKLGLINSDGSSANPNSIIDFSKEYTGSFLSNNYEISQGIGNMLPSIAISMVNPVAGSVAMGVSAGYDYMASLLYGLITGSSEAITERILGGLPGLSETSVTGLKTWLNSMRKEANQEMFQGVLDAIVRNMVFGEPLPESAEDWEEFAKDILKQGAYGAITAGYMNAPSAFSGIINTKIFNNYISQHNISESEIANILKQLKEQNPELAKFTDEEIIAKFGKKIIADFDNGVDPANISINEMHPTNESTEEIYARVGEDLGVTIKIDHDTLIPNSNISIDPIVVIDGVEYRIVGYVNDGVVGGGSKHISSEIQNTLNDYVIDPSKVNAIFAEYGLDETYESIKNGLIEENGGNQNVESVLRETIEAKIKELTGKENSNEIIDMIFDGEESFSRLKRNLVAAGMDVGDLSNYSIEELYQLNAEAQLRLNVIAVQKAANKEFVYYDNGELKEFNSDITDITGVKLYVNASSDLDVLNLVEVIAYYSKEGQNGDIQVIHLCPPKNETECVTPVESTINQVKRNMTQKIGNSKDTNIFNDILNKMVEEGMPSTLKDYKNLSPEQKQANIDKICDAFYDTIVSDISADGYNMIGDESLREAGVDMVKQLVESKEFRDLVRKRILVSYLQGNDSAFIRN